MLDDDVAKAGKAAAEVMEKTATVETVDINDELNDEDRAWLKKLRERGNHAYNEDQIPAPMVKLHKLGLVERRGGGVRKVFCLKGDA